MNAISLHECRHTFASLMIAAGVNAKALQTFMGHASITVTLDLYRHLFPGSEDEAAVLLDAYRQAARRRSRAKRIRILVPPPESGRSMLSSAAIAPITESPRPGPGLSGFGDMPTP